MIPKIQMEFECEKWHSTYDIIDASSSTKTIDQLFLDIYSANNTPHTIVTITIVMYVES